MTIVIFGSINMDLVVRASHLPTPGETLTGDSFDTIPGGKGANQAVACARLGVNTRMVGRVGDDSFGQVLREGMQADGIDTTHVTVTPRVSSGVALITVDAQGENTIIVVPAANGRVDHEDLSNLKNALVGANVLLLQLEVPLPMVIEAARIAHDLHGVQIVLDPAPVPNEPFPDDLYHLVDIITPNETEASALVGFKVDDETTARKAAEILMQRGAKRVVIKMGSKGAFFHDGDAVGILPVHSVEAVDTVAAGDAFNGGLAVALSEGQSFQNALRWAMISGALATTKHGAQPAMPTRTEVVGMMK